MIWFVLNEVINYVFIVGKDIKKIVNHLNVNIHEFVEILVSIKKRLG